MNSELELFRTKPMQTNIVKTFEVAYKPLTSLENSSVIEFASLANIDQYRDLSSIYIRFRVKLFKDAKNTAHTDSSVGPVNNVLHSLIRQCSIYLNGKPVQTIDSNYAYRAYIENLLNYSKESAEVHLDGVGWSIDTPGQLESVTGKDNMGLTTRQNMFGSSCECELVGRLHADMLNQPKLLMNNVDLRIVLTMEKSSFYIMAVDSDESHIKILDATMYMNHVVVSEPVQLAHRSVLQTKNAIYDYNRVEVKSFTVAKDTQNISLDNVVVGNLPNLMLIGMVENQAYTGKRSLNPYNFQHFNISQFNITVNGVKIPSHPIDINFTDANHPITSRAYDKLFRGSNLHELDRSMQITRKFFNAGAMLFAFDLTPDQSYQHSNCVSPIQKGIVNIEAQFSEALKKTITVLIYSEYDAQIEIDRDYNVYTVK